MAGTASLMLKRVINASKNTAFLRIAGFKHVKCVLPSSTVIPKRYISEKVLEEEEAKQTTWFAWLLENVFTASSTKEKVTTPEEIQERDELLARIQACYYKKPPEEPGKEFFEEAFNLLIKYEDWRGVEGLWRLGQSHGHEFDDDLLDKIEDYLLEARQKRWYE